MSTRETNECTTTERSVMCPNDLNISSWLLQQEWGCQRNKVSSKLHLSFRSFYRSHGSSQELDEEFDDNLLHTNTRREQLIRNDSKPEENRSHTLLSDYNSQYFMTGYSDSIWVLYQNQVSHPYGISNRKRFLQTSSLAFAVLKEKVSCSLRLLLLDLLLSLLEGNRMNPNMIRTTTTPPIMMISSFDRVLTKAESAFPRIPVRKEEKDC